MTPDKIKYGLEQYSRLSLDPQQAMTVHVDKRGHQTALPWHVIASNALKYVELMEELCMAAKEEPMGKLFLHITGLNYELEKENKDLTQRNERQAEIIRELQEAKP